MLATAVADRSYFPLQDLLAIGLIAGLVYGAFGKGFEWVSRRFRKKIEHDEKERKLDELLKRVTPNGKNTYQLGDIAARTEDKVDKLTKAFTNHRNAVNRRLKALEAK